MAGSNRAAASSTTVSSPDTVNPTRTVKPATRTRLLSAIDMANSLGCCLFGGSLIAFTPREADARRGRRQGFRNYFCERGVDWRLLELAGPSAICEDYR